MWLVAIQVGILVAAYVYHRVTAPDAPKRSYQSAPTMPTTEEGISFPLIYGRIRVRQPVLAWWGNFSNFVNDPSQPLVTNYGMDLLMVLGIPPSTVVKQVTMADGSVVNRPTYGQLLSIFIGDRQIPMFNGWNQSSPVPGGGITDVTTLVSWQSLADQGPFGAREYAALPPYASLGVSGETSPAGTGMVFCTEMVPGGCSFVVAFWDGHEVIGETHQDVGAKLHREGFNGSNGPVMSSISLNSIPGYAHMMCVLFNTITPVKGSSGFQLASYAWGTDAQPPNITCEVQDGTQSGISVPITFPGPFPGTTTTGDANPIGVIIDLLCGSCSFGKVGLDPAVLDPTTFYNAAVTLKAEEHGFSMHVVEGTSCVDLIGQILQQIAAVMWVDQQTTTLKIKLLRADYDPATIPAYGVADVKELRGYSTSSWSETYNKIVVTFTNRLTNYDSGTVTAQALGNAASNDNRVRTKTISYTGICDPVTAGVVAARDLSVLSRPFAKCQMVSNRRASTLSVGDVISLTWPEFNLSSVVFRVVGVDLGAMENNLVVVDLLQDALADKAVSHTTYPPVYVLEQAAPLLRRRVEEAPWWLQSQANLVGAIFDPSSQHILALATSGEDSHFSVATQGMITNDALAPDVVKTEIAVSFQVDSTYARELEPYDTSVGLFVKTQIDSASYKWLSTTTATHDAILYQGKTLILVGGEMMAYESATNLGSGRFRLNNVWRALGDTAPVAHAINEDVYVLGTNFGSYRFVGRRSYGNDAFQPITRVITAVESPTFAGLTLGGATGETLPQMRVRCNLGVPRADFRLSGFVMTGTAGANSGGSSLPLSAVKIVTSMEEEFIADGNVRSRLATVLSRGDESQASDADVTYEVWGRKSPAVAVKLADLPPITGSSVPASHLLGSVGYGQINVQNRALRTRNEVGKTPIGVYEWDTPQIALFAPRWRNLLCNARFQQSSNGATDLSPGWTSTTGTPVNLRSVSGIDRNGGASGIGFVTSTVASTPAVFKQSVDVSGYFADRMTANLEYYAFNNGDVNDTVVVSMQPCDATGAGLAVPTTDTFTPASLTWGRRAFSIASLPAGTMQIAIIVTLNAVSDTTPSSCVTEWRLQLGQMQDNVLANYSFETGLTSWTTTLGTAVAATAVPGASPAYVVGGAVAAYQLTQDFTLPAGWEEGTSVVLNAWVINTLANDTSSIAINILDAGGATIGGNSTTNIAIATTNMWQKRRVAVDTVEGAVKIRVILTGNRALGSGTCGIGFDEVVMQLHKDLTDPRVSYDFVLTSPSVQKLPRDWNEFWQAYPDLVADQGLPRVITGDVVAVQSRFIGTSASLRWSDGVAHDKVLAPGQFGGGVSSTYAFRTARVSGAAAPHVVSWGTGEVTTPLCRPSSAATSNMIVAVLFRVDESAFSTACGIVGRRDSLGGWSLDIDTSGHLVASLSDGFSVVTATDTTLNVADGAWHLGVFALSGGFVAAMCEQGVGATASVAALGDITLGSSPLQIMRSRDTIDTLPGCVARVYIWDNMADGYGTVRDALWNLGKDTTGQITYSRAAPAWAAGRPDSIIGETLNLLAPTQIAYGYDANLALFLDAYVGDGVALAVSGAPYTNLIPSFDFANAATFFLEAGCSQKVGVQPGPNGRYANSLLTMVAGGGMQIKGLVLNATTTVQFAFFAMNTTGTMNMRFELENSSNVVKNTQTQAIPGDGLWHKYVISFTGWDASTATGIIRISGVTTTVLLSICEIMYACQGTVLPTLWPSTATGTMSSDTTITLSGLAMTKQLNMEGAIQAHGVMTATTQPSSVVIAAVRNATNLKNARELSVVANHATLAHYDATPTAVNSTGPTPDWRQPWIVHGRWKAAKMLDNATNPYAGLVTLGSTGVNATYGRTATFTYDATHAATLKVGVGAAGGAANMLLRRLVLRTAEAKL